MDTINQQLERVVQQRQAEAPARLSRYQDDSRKRLLKILQRKHRTSFIGALAQFEAHFGHLWAHGKAEGSCTENELAWRQVWDTCRTEVLNNGNNQLRAVESEVQQYTVVWNRYQMTLVPMEKDN